MRLAVLGDPVAHSLSPAMHTAALAAAEIPGSYVARRVDADGLIAAAGEIRDGTLDGVNVTMPHKQLAARTCDRLAPVAESAGAVNTIVRVGADLVGHNTDVAGIRSAWTVSGLPEDDPVVILGNGGAAAAALLALAGKKLSISSRRPGAGAALAASVGADAEEVPWAAAFEGVVVNATPIGMRGEGLPDAVLSAATGLFDMAYGSAPTPAVALAASKGVPFADGVSMLAAQARDSFRLWTGYDVPLALFADAARDQMRGTVAPAP